MPIKQDGSKVVVTGKISGSVFPTNEKDTVFPVLIEGESAAATIEGALYGRSLEMRGAVSVLGPVVARGDLRISPRGKLIQMLAGLTVNGSVNCEPKIQNLSDQIDVQACNRSGADATLRAGQMVSRRPDHKIRPGV